MGVIPMCLRKTFWKYGWLENPRYSEISLRDLPV